MQKPVRLQSDSKWSIHRSRCKAVSTWIETTTNGNVESFKKMNPKRTCLNTTTWLLYHTGQIVQIFFFNLKKQNKTKKHTWCVCGLSCCFTELHCTEPGWLEMLAVFLSVINLSGQNQNKTQTDLQQPVCKSVVTFTKNDEKKTKRDVFH